MRKYWIVFVGLALVMTAATAAQAAPEQLKVSVKVAPPFIMVEQGGQIEGFSVDLIHEVARRMKPERKVVFRVQPDLKTQLEVVAAGEVDLGIAATTITAERERKLDFTQPFFRSGLGIMVPAEADPVGTLRSILSSDLIWLFAGTVLYILLFAHLIWWAERGSDAFNDRWLPGVAQGVWWVVVTMSTVGYGDIVPKKTISKVLAIVIIFSGIILFGLAVASISSALTLQNLRGDISGPEDLAGRRVAVVSNSTSEAAMEKRGARLVLVKDVAQGAELLQGDQVDAVVHDMPILQHFMRSTEGDQVLQVLTDALFEPADYGITLPEKSPLLEEVNRALLELTTEDEKLYRHLRHKWLGSGEGSTGQ